MLYSRKADSSSSSLVWNQCILTHSSCSWGSDSPRGRRIRARVLHSHHAEDAGNFYSE